MTTTVPTKTRSEVNLHLEMFYPDSPGWKERLQQDLPDYNFVFLTELDEDASLTEILADAVFRMPKIREFLNENDEFIADIFLESFDQVSEGVYCPDWGELIMLENTCGQADNPET